MPNFYVPERNAFAQSDYHDQQGSALAGALAYASDLNLVDSFVTGPVGENGLEAGLAVVAKANASALRPGINELAAVLPGESDSAADIAGVSVRAQQMPSNSAGRACYFQGDLCSVARTGRSGARIFVRLVNGAQPAVNAPAFVILGGDNAGRFDSAEGQGRVLVPAMVFKSAAEDGIALVELL
ncbi:hypothetical protein LJC59_09120 [Desulfovibrio sp. OttesenSCG-928-A18]|nr:hypothetical protein [Desulfovibrio sp. OttesenSCG-928-A18]